MTEPPASDSAAALPDGVECPFCGGTETELHSLFGSAASLITYWCRHCHTAFETLKWAKRE